MVKKFNISDKKLNPIKLLSKEFENFNKKIAINKLNFYNFYFPFSLL